MHYPNLYQLEGTDYSIGKYESLRAECGKELQ